MSKENKKDKKESKKPYSGLVIFVLSFLAVLSTVIVIYAGTSNSSELGFDVFSDLLDSNETIQLATPQIIDSSASEKESPTETEKIIITEIPVETETPSPTPKPTEAPKIDTLTISFAGDCTLGADLRLGKWNSMFDIAEKNGNNLAFFFENVKPIFNSDDITVVNFESTFTDSDIAADKEFVFKAPPSYTAILTEGGVETVNLANNHTKDYLDKGYQDTKANLENVGIGYFGYDNMDIREVNGIKVGFLGYSGWGYSDSTKKQISDAIASLRESGAQIVAVSFHWGKELDRIPNSTQKSLGHFAIDSGADIVVGHHPHVIQGIEYYNEKPIVYSLGNFCFGGHRNPKDKDTIIFQQKYTYEEGKLITTESVIIPCHISSLPNQNNYQPTPVYDNNADQILNKLLEYSKGFNSDDFIKSSFKEFVLPEPKQFDGLIHN